jgi:hypothetical protein
VYLNVIYNFLFFDALFAPVNLLRFLLKMLAETHAGLHIRCPVILSDFNINMKAVDKFNKILNIKFNEICSVVLELLSADKHTVRGEANRHTLTTFHCARAKKLPGARTRQ